MMNCLLSLGSNWLPFEVNSFDVTGRTPGTDALHEAEDMGAPLEVTLAEPAETITNVRSLDQILVSLD
jgi:hypothetical protein